MVFPELEEARLGPPVAAERQFSAAHLVEQVGLHVEREAQGFLDRRVAELFGYDGPEYIFVIEVVPVPAEVVDYPLVLSAGRLA